MKFEDALKLAMTRYLQTLVDAVEVEEWYEGDEVTPNIFGRPTTTHRVREVVEITYRDMDNNHQIYKFDGSLEMLLRRLSLFEI